MDDAPIYPGLIPALAGHPTTGRFEIVDSNDARGRGLRAKASFGQGAAVARLSGVLVPQSSLDTIQISPFLHLHDAWFARFLLHSCEPNLRIDLATIEAIAVRDIAAGDYLTLDYAATEDRLARQFACECGAAACRGWMLGRKEEPNAEGRAFLAKRDAARIGSR